MLPFQEVSHSLAAVWRGGWLAHGTPGQHHPTDAERGKTAAGVTAGRDPQDADSTQRTVLHSRWRLRSAQQERKFCWAGYLRRFQCNKISTRKLISESYGVILLSKPDCWSTEFALIKIAIMTSFAIRE